MSISRYYRNFILPFLNHPLNRNRKISALRRFATWQFLLRMLHRQNSEAVVPFIGDVKMIVRRGLSGITGNLYSGLHEFNEMIFLLHYLRAEDVFFDVGSNVGSYTLLASGHQKATTYAFEPVPATFERLRRHVYINGLEDRVVLHNAAAGSQKGTIAFTTELDAMNHVVSDNYAGKTITVALVTIDEELYERGVRANVIKVDAEGYDKEVIEGAKKQLADLNLNVVFLESDESSLLDLVYAHGFQPISYCGFSRKITIGDKNRYHTIFVRNVDLVNNRVETAPKVQVLNYQI